MKIFTRIFCMVAFLTVNMLSFAATYTVSVNSTTFSPQNLVVDPGDVVIFQWVAGTHPVMSDNNVFPAFNIASSTPTKSMVMNNAGTFGYHCMAHGAPGTGMFGTIVVRTVTGVKEFKNAATLSAFPNPTKGETTITLNHANGENYKIRISNAIGRVVKTIEIPKHATDSKIEVDLGNMPAGFYFYSLLANDKMIETKRLILQH